jgi:hypothetical protein
MSEWKSSGVGTQPIPDAWRSLLREVVSAFMRGDFGLSNGISRVRPVAARSAARARDYVADYGETLVELPEAAWLTSFAQRVTDRRWDVYVDLWTAESGRSDMVLSGIFDGPGPEAAFSFHLIYVP